MAIFFDFPEEIVFQILSWLPVIYLLRCKSVCKQWLSIISDPLFTQTHLTNSHKTPSVLAIADTLDSSVYSFYLINDSFEDSINLHVPSCSAICLDYDRFTCCNGLVCLTDYSGFDIYIWNPSTRQCCKILPSRMTPNIWAYTGFYFDPISNDYKILRIETFQSPLRVELYSTNSHTWREIEVDTSFGTSIVSYGPVIKEVFYINCRDGLLSFQLCNEMFKPVPLPSIKLRDVSRPRSGIFDYEGHVGLILHCHDDKTLSLWSLDEDDGSGIVSWTKNFNLETGFRIEWDTTYLGDGRLVIHEDRKFFILYDYRTKETKKFQHPAWNLVRSSHKHTESLVSIKGFYQNWLSGRREFGLE